MLEVTTRWQHEALVPSLHSEGGGTLLTFKMNPGGGERPGPAG